MANKVLGLAQPPADVPVIDQRGMVNTAWLGFFASLVAMPPPVIVVDPTVTASPFAYTASRPGSALVLGGVVSLLNLARGRTSIDLVGVVAGFVPLGMGDTLTITYSGAPSVWFIPT